MIKIQDYDSKKQKITFVTDMPISLTNAIRRSVLEIPVLAVDEVEIIKNDSALYDEMLAHRIGLIPLKTKDNLKEAKFKLKETGPKIIYSTDLKPNVGTDCNLPLTILDKDQEIELVANAILGKGVEHIKYSPGLMYYKHNLNPELLEFVNIDEEGKIEYNEKEIKEATKDKSIGIDKLEKINELIIALESWGQIEVKDLFLKSIEILDDNLKELSDNLR